MGKFIITASIFLVAVFAYGIPAASEKLMVTVSSYPLAHFAEQVGGEHVKVVNITPEGVDPHEYEPTARDMMKIWTAQVFIFSGAGLDPWGERVRDDLRKRGVLIICMTEHFELLRNGEDARYGNGRYDPHIWLDPLLVMQEVEIIRDTFIRADPENESSYRNNSIVYSDKLAMLHRRYSEELKNCQTSHIIVSHDALRYLAKRYDLKIHPIAGLSPEEEPTPRKMTEIVKLARENNIKYIFTEVLVSPRIAETIAREVGAETLVFNPAGGLTENEIRAGKTYISIMKENLVNLRTAMSCN